MNYGELFSTDEALNVADEAIVSTTGNHLTDIQRVILLGALQGHTYEDIAAAYDYSAKYLKQDAGPALWKLLSQALQEDVSKRNFRFALERRWKGRREISSELRSTTEHSSQSQKQLEPDVANGRFGNLGPNHNPRINWSTRWAASPDTSLFIGRETELERLADWIIGGCRLLMVFGIPGIGKTTLAVKLARQVQEQFDVVIWRSLNNWELKNRPPSLPDLLENLILCITNQPEHRFDLSQLLEYMIRYRCLIVLDGLESVLQGGSYQGCYQQGYEAYGELLYQVGRMTTIQQSCLILTSQENCKAIEEMEFELPTRVRSERLKGLGEISGRDFVACKGKFWGSESDWNRLINYYGGNPLVLSRTASRIQHLFGGDIAKFVENVKHSPDQFGDIQALLSPLFDRLSAAEHMIIRCLTDSHQPITFEVLQTIAPSLSEQELSEVLSSLRRRGLIEGNSTYLLPTIVGKYIAAH